MPRASKGLDISLIIPIYNGQPYVEKTTREYYSAFQKNSLIHSFEIILVTNNCSDDSPNIAQSLARKHSEIVHLDFPFKTLKGGAVIRGFQQARYDLVGFADVDNATPPQEFLKLLPVMKDEKVGAAIASRKMPDSTMLPPQPFSRRMLGTIFSFIREMLFRLDIVDSQCGAKLFRKKAIEPLELISPGFSFDVELLYRTKKNGFLIREIGVAWHDRAGSTVTFFTPFFMLRELIKLRLAVGLNPFSKK